MKIWVDDIRDAPPGYLWCRDVLEAITDIRDYGSDASDRIEVLDLDHDAGDCYNDGGDYIEILKVMEEHIDEFAPLFVGGVPIIHLHSMNPVGVANMRAIIQHNGWKEV